MEEIGEVIHAKNEENELEELWDVAQLIANRINQICKDDKLKLNEWQFHQRKFLPYNMKLQLTKNRIWEWFEHWDGEIYISFSGGLDSTGKSRGMVYKQYLHEYSQLRQFVNTFKNVTVIKPKISFRQVIKKYGYPIMSKETAAKIRKLRHGNWGSGIKIIF